MTNQKNSLPKGTMLRGGDNDYRIEKVLGSGSFGITYLASYQDRSGLSIYVALKEFFMSEINGREGTSVTTGSKDGLFGDYRRKFAREAKNLTKLNHPNIIKVMEYFECNNTSYYTMEYLEGGSLDDYIKQHGALGEKQALDFANQIGEALSYMHSHKMLHLDLKPKNIMLRGDGSLVLIDFGLAKQYDASGTPESSTKVGGGTPGYAPLEQANYHDGNDFPITMDVYAFGATIYKMLTSQTPPEASEILNDRFQSAQSALKAHHVGIVLAKTIKRAMSPTKSSRYQSVGTMMAALNGQEQSEEEEGTDIYDNHIDSKHDEQELRNHVQHLIDIKEYREAFRTCNRYLNEGRCTATAHELLDKVVPMMKEATKKSNRKEKWLIVIFMIISIIVGIIAGFAE